MNFIVIEYYSIHMGLVTTYVKVIISL